MSELPRGWITARVEDFAIIVQYGSSAKTAESGDVPVLRMGNIFDGRLRFDDLKYLPAAHPEFPELLLAPGDVLFNRTNSAELVGKTAVYDGVPSPCSFASYLLRLRLHGYEPRFLSNYINSPYGRAWIATVVQQQVGQANVNGTKLRELEIPVPSLAEQRRIVNKIDALTSRSRRAKEALYAIPALLERFRQSVLAAAFRGDLTAEWRAKNPDVEPADKLLARIRLQRRLRWDAAELAKMLAKGKKPGDDRWKDKYEEPESIDADSLPDLPEGWCWAILGDVAPLQAGYAFPSTGFRSSGVRLLKGVNVRDGWLSTDELDYWDPADTGSYQHFLLHGGDIVLAMDRPVYSSGSKATKVAKLDTNWEGALLLQRVGRFQPLSLLRTEYLYLFLRSGMFRSHLINKQNGTQDGKDLPHVSARVVDAAIIPIPPVDEQDVLVARAAVALSKTEIVSEQLTSSLGALGDLDRAILAKAFRGELVPQDPADEPASVLLDRLRAERAQAATPSKGRASPAPARPRARKPAKVTET
ncbi:MAG: restriction endonuclease subunit S [Minicystis sp.]